jgi:predicted alpha/beta superfamily hydrolase
LEKPNLFGAYIASDPSLWWDNNLLARKLSAGRRTPSGMTVRVFIAQANTPDSVPGEHDAHKAGIAAFRTAMEKQRPPALWLYRYFDDETHFSVPLQAIYRGLLFVNDGYIPAPPPTSAVAPSNKSLERTRER